jgi:small-conductance mechanosensitive channel
MAVVLSIGVFAPIYSPAWAQNAASGTYGGAVSSDDLAKALDQASKGGGNTIIIENAPQSDLESAQPSSEGYDGAYVIGKPKGAAALMQAQTEVEQFRETLGKRIAALPVAINEVQFILRASSPDGNISTFAKVLLWSLLLFAIGMIVEREVFGKRFAKQFVVRRIQSSPKGYEQKLPFLIFRFLMGALGVAVSMVVAYALGTIFFGPTDDTAIRFTIVVINVSYAGCRLVALTWRMILTPFLCQYRIPQFSNRDAMHVYYWLCGVAVVDIASLMFSIWISELGLNYDIFAMMSILLGLTISLLNVAMVLVNRRAISRAFRNGRGADEVSVMTKLASRLWAPAVIIYVTFAWFELTFDLVLERPTSVPLIAGAYAIIISIIVVYAAINYTIERYFNRSRALRAMQLAMIEGSADGMGAPGDIDPDLDELTHNRPSEMENFEDLARRISGILALVAGIWACVRIWGANEMIPEGTPIELILDLMVIVFIGYIVYHAFRIWVDTKIAEEQGEVIEVELGDEGGASSASRLATLLPLFRNFILLIIIVTVALIALLEMGINVSPLFAGAGVVGLAIGFGAQSLVKDIFSGAFFLFDDAFRKGEYIDIGSVKGTVEKISVRSFQLRHHLGPLHTIPFGEIQFLTNYSRDWVMMKLPLRVTYDTDVEKVRKLIKKLGQELLSDPVIGDNFLQPLKSQGVIEMQDSAMIIRIKFMTKPGDQWLIRKKVFQEIRDLFEREGIKFAHREVTVRLADSDTKDMSAEQKQAVAAASHAALIEEGLLEEGGEKGGDDR